MCTSSYQRRTYVQRLVYMYKACTSVYKRHTYVQIFVHMYNACTGLYKHRTCVQVSVHMYNACTSLYKHCTCVQTFVACTVCLNATQIQCKNKVYSVIRSNYVHLNLSMYFYIHYCYFCATGIYRYLEVNLQVPAACGSPVPAGILAQIPAGPGTCSHGSYSGHRSGFFAAGDLCSRSPVTGTGTHVHLYW
jgi:hypothetical protein